MQPPNLRKWLPLLAALFVVIFGATGLSLYIDDGDPATPPIDVGKLLRQLATAQPAAAVPNGPGELEQHTKEADETPPEVDPQRTAAGAAKTYARDARLADDVERFGPLATQGADGCRTKYNTRNYSSRNGAKILLGVAHRTVSPNRPGWGDVYGVAEYLNRAGVQASTGAIVDFEGNCLLTVPRGLKAWTQGFFNPWSYSVEMIGNPRDPISAAQYGRTAALIANAGVPPRRARASGCGVQLSGVIDHNALGCGNNHTDITPYTIAPIIAAMRPGANAAADPRTKVEQVVAAKRCAHRRQLIRRRNVAVNLRWARHYKRRVRGTMDAIDAAKRRDGRPWSYRHRGVRRHLQARALSGRGC